MAVECGCAPGTLSRNSNPIEGIVEAIRTYHDTGKKISLYVFVTNLRVPRSTRS
jgi:hypothetical protein